MTGIGTGEQGKKKRSEMEEVKTKICTKCGEEKPATTEYFYRNKNLKLGLSYYCKTCGNESIKRWRENNRERIKESKMIWAKNNQQKVKESREKYIKNNTEKVREYRKRWRKNNPEKMKEINAAIVSLLRSNYVKNIIHRKYGIQHSEIPTELIEMKRKQLKYYRELRQLKEELK